MEKVKKVRRKVGDILYIDLGNGHHGYAHVSTDPCIIFYEGRFDHDIEIKEIVKLPVLFQLFVSNFAIKERVWKVIGHESLSEEMLKVPYMYKKDPISGRLSIYHEDFSATNYVRAATLDECRKLERAAVWDPEHVVSRLNDFYDNIPNKWVLSMQL